MAIEKLIFCLCLISISSCSRDEIPETTLRQASKPLPFYLSPENDISIKEAQDWLITNPYKIKGNYEVNQHLNWELAVDQGYFLEVPFKTDHKVPPLNDRLNPDELAKLEFTQAEWGFSIAKSDNNYFFHTVIDVPFKEFARKRKRSKENLYEMIRRKDNPFIGVRLIFNQTGSYGDCVEMSKGRTIGIVGPNTKKLPSTLLTEEKYDELVIYM